MSRNHPRRIYNQILPQIRGLWAQRNLFLGPVYKLLKNRATYSRGAQLTLEHVWAAFGTKKKNFCEILGTPRIPFEF